MQNAESLSREQIQEFLRSSEPVEFVGGGRDERYGSVERVLAAQKYGELSKRERGLVRAYMRKVTGLSEAQTTRLIRAFLDHGKVQAQPYQRHRFAANTYYWVDPKLEMIGIYMTQHMVSIEPAQRDFQVLTYQALVD